MGGPTCCSTGSVGAGTFWPTPAFFFLFLCCVWEVVPWFIPATTLGPATSWIISAGVTARSAWGSGSAASTVGLSAANVDWSGPAFRLFFRFWVTEGVAPGSAVICEALRLPRVGSSGSTGSRGAGFGGSTTGRFALEKVVATSTAFYSTANEKGAWDGADALPLVGPADLR